MLDADELRADLDVSVEHVEGVLDTDIIAALAAYGPADLPDELLISAVTLGELSHGPHATDDPVKRARFLRAGVSVKLHQWPGTFHGSQAILSAEISQRQIAELGSALRRAVSQ